MPDIDLRAERPRPPGGPRIRNQRAYLGEERLDGTIGELLRAAGVAEESELYREMIVNVIKLSRNQPRLGDLRLMLRSMRELRVSDQVFSKYRDTKKVSIFGSARTSPEEIEFQRAHQFARMMVDAGFMVITGGGEGIMGAAQAGAGRERSFGLNIMLPFEQAANETIQNDAKLITYKYFFTRKLHFVKESHAVVCFPGGFGTMDEVFETLTLIQTGKARLVPVILIDRPGGRYWASWREFIEGNLLGKNLISPEDFHLFKITDDLEAARAEVTHFYNNFHSYRFVGENLVLRLQRQIPATVLRALEKEFADLCVVPKFTATAMLPAESNEPEIADLPRLCLPFNLRAYGRLRMLINRLNDF